MADEPCGSRRPLAPRRALMRAGFEQSRLPIVWTRGPEHRIRAVNASFSKLFEDLWPWEGPLWGLLSEGAGKTLRKLFDAVYASGIPSASPELCARLVTVSPLFGKGALPDGLTVVVLDRPDEEDRAQRVRREQRVLSSISHDLRNPLGAIRLSAELILRRRDELVPAHLSAVKRILDATDTATRLVGDLMDFTQARLNEGLPLHLRAADFHQLVRRAVAAETPGSAPDRRVEVACEGPGFGDVDPARLGQAIRTLVKNALEHTPKGSVVTVTSRGALDGWRLSVQNPGKPIHPARLRRMFEPGARDPGHPGAVDRSIAPGLYLVEQVAKAHQGSVEVRSVGAEGTLFTLRIPVRAPVHRTSPDVTGGLCG